MCWKCKNPCCEQCPTTPPEGLTESELERNGWLNQPSQQEMERIRTIGKATTEKGHNFFDTFIKRKK